MQDLEFTYVVPTQLYIFTIFTAAGNQALAFSGNIPFLWAASHTPGFKKMELVDSQGNFSLTIPRRQVKKNEVDNSNIFKYFSEHLITKKTMFKVLNDRYSGFQAGDFKFTVKPLSVER
jgi:hypothetical protein